MTMHPKKRILAGLTGGRVDQIPVWLPVVAVTVPMMEKAKAPWPQAHKDPELMAKLAAMPWELCRLPAVTVPFCLSLEAEALGCALDWGTINRTPSVKSHPYRRPADFAVPDNLLERGRIPVVLEAVEILSERLGPEVPITAKVTGGFTIAGHLFGVSNLVSWIKTDPEYVREAVDKASDVTVELIRAFEAAGADIISISDPTASGDLLSGEHYRKFVLPSHKKISAVPWKPTVLHICGYTKELLPHIRTAGFDAYSFEEKIDVSTAKQLLGDDVSLVGNVAPVGTMLQGTPEKVTKDAFEAMAGGIDVLSSGCTLSPFTTLENIRALAAAPEKYRLSGSPATRSGDHLMAPLQTAEDQVSVEALLPTAEPYRSIAGAVVGGDVDRASALAAEAIRGGADPLTVALEGLLKGMDVISVLYNHRQAYVPEILLAAKALNAGLAETGGSAEALGRRGTVLIHTADGDLHDIGKNIVASIFEANGYRVVDLGTSVETARVIEAIRQYRPVALLGSSLMTSTRGAFLTTADELKKQGLQLPFILGGGACDEAFARQRENLRYAKDPEAAIKLLEKLSSR